MARTRTNIRVEARNGYASGEVVANEFCVDDQHMFRTFYALIMQARCEGYDMRISPNGVFAMGDRRNLETNLPEYRVVDCFYGWQE